MSYPAISLYIAELCHSLFCHKLLYTANGYANTGKVGSEREGVVQLEFNGRTGYVCSDGWHVVDVEVACIELDLEDDNGVYDTSPEGK